MDFGYSSDNIGPMGYIDRERILERYDEEDIFSLVFGYRPVLHRYVTSPFREDNTPGCHFSVSPSGKLRFVDFANRNIRHGVNMSNMDCFDAVQVYFKLPNFYQVLKFIEKHLSQKEGVGRKKKKREKKVKKKVEMFFEARNFVPKDAEFWSKYRISSANLLEDNVFPVSRILMKNTIGGDVDSLLRETCYAITGFENRIKFYFPFRENRGRYVTNCTQNDIGHMDRLPPYARQLIYTKGYKDSRVLINSGRYAVWNQNEGMFPDDNVLFSLVKRFDKVVVLYDNDKAGARASKEMAEKINSQFPLKARALTLPERYLENGIKDPSDLIAHSFEEYNQFLLNSSI